MKKWHIGLALLLLTIGFVGYTWHVGSKPIPESESTASQLIETTTGQVTLVELAVMTNSPQVGQDLAIGLNLDHMTTPLSAISIKLTLPLETTDQFGFDDKPFDISQNLKDDGWQVLINQISLGDEYLEAELALGRLSIDPPKIENIFEQTFATLTLNTLTPIVSGEVFIDSLLSKIVTSEGQTLPLQITNNNYSVLENH